MIDFINTYPLVLAIIIFFARIVDVSLATIRTIMVFRGYRALSAFIGFFEVLIWVVAAGQVVKNLSYWPLAVAYAAGFATGNIVGIFLEEKIALGNVVVMVISEDLEVKLTQVVREQKYIATEMVGKGKKGLPVEITLITVKRKKLPTLIHLIEKTDSTALYTVQDLRRLYSTDIVPDNFNPLGIWAKKK